MPENHKSKYWIDKMARRKSPRYPIATIAYYGPDDSFASKVVIGIVLATREEPTYMKKWFASEIDVRLDERINEQILEFIMQHMAARVTMIERIIGCPHEEGIDYPEDQACPQCPFWENRDRWTGELIE